MNVADFVVGQPVHVWAFGRVRRGTVAKLGKTRVVVHYERNALGTLAARSFPAHMVMESDPTTGEAVVMLQCWDLEPHAPHTWTTARGNARTCLGVA